MRAIVVFGMLVVVIVGGLDVVRGEVLAGVFVVTYAVVSERGGVWGSL